MVWQYWLRWLPTSCIGVLARFCVPIARLANISPYRSILTNLMLVNPKQSANERKHLAQEVLYNQITSLLYSAKSWAMPPAWTLKQIIQVHGLQIIERGHKNPNGMIIVAPHIGAWELLTPWLAQFGNFTILYKPLNDPDLDAFIHQSRERLNANLVPTDGSGVKALFATLKKGGFTAILPDHVPDVAGGEIVPFFGIPTLTGTLTSKLATKTGCALVGLCCIKADQGFHVHCYDLNDPALFDAQAKVATAALNRAMQAMIEVHFSHYMWSYRRFKFTPFGENPYLLPFDELHHQVKNYKNQDLS